MAAGEFSERGRVILVSVQKGDYIKRIQKKRIFKIIIIITVIMSIIIILLILSKIIDHNFYNLQLRLLPCQQLENESISQS